MNLVDFLRLETARVLDTSRGCHDSPVWLSAGQVMALCDVAEAARAVSTADEVAPEQLEALEVALAALGIDDEQNPEQGELR